MSVRMRFGIILFICWTSLVFAGPTYDGVNDTTSPGTPGSYDPADGFYHWADPVNWTLDTLPDPMPVATNVSLVAGARVKIDRIGNWDYNRVYAASNAGSPAFVKVTAGTLRTKDQIAAGWATGSEGTFIVDGGTVDIYGTGGAGGFGGLTVGYFGAGHFELRSGSVNARVMTVGVQPAGTGIIRISGGTLTVSDNTYLPQNASAAIVDMTISGTGIADIGTLAGQPEVNFALPGRNLDIRDAGVLIVRGAYSDTSPIAGIKGNGIPGHVMYNYDASGNVTTVTANPLPYQAWNPSPSDGQDGVSTNILLNWLPGDHAVSHDIVFGTDRNKVALAMRVRGDLDGSGVVELRDLTILSRYWLQYTDQSEPWADIDGNGYLNAADLGILADNWLQTAPDEYKGNQLNTEFSPTTLLPDRTYYWRVDQIHGQYPAFGEIWSFTTAPESAYDPCPADHAEGTGAENIQLKWKPGAGAVLHDIYFGTNWTQVSSATTQTAGIYKGRQDETIWHAGNLNLNQIYYWRIDEVTPQETVKGRTWTFTAVNCGMDWGIKPPQHLYAVPLFGQSYEELIALTSLQGIIAQTRPELFIFKNGLNDLWLNDLRDNYSVEVTYVNDIRGAQTCLEWALSHYADRLNGYVLYDAHSNSDSLNIASSLAGILGGPAIDITIESTAHAAGLPLLADVRGRTNLWLYSNYSNQFTKRAVIVKDPNPASWYCSRLHDLSAAIRCLVLWDSNKSFTGGVFSDLINNSPCFGWGDAAYPNDEGGFVDYHASHSLVTQPSNGLLNLSAYMGMASIEEPITFRQPLRGISYPSENGVHYLCFIHTDMDNLTFIIQNWAVDPARFGNTRRGQFAMGWGMPAAMLKMAPQVMKWWYNHATVKDCFILPFSGMGYIHPDQFPAMQDFVAQAGRYMARADIRTILINNPNQYAGGSTNANLFAGIPSARGFFVSGNPYHEFGDDIRWYGNKPFISVKYSLWDGFESPSSLASKVNKRPADPTQKDGYTVVTVHAWSYTLDDVWNCIQQLDENVKVVTPEELIERVHQNNVGR